MQALQQFLTSHASRPFEWGVCDCCLFMADWVLAVRGVDPAKGVRGECLTEREAIRKVEEVGGMVALIGSFLDPMGLQRVQQPRRGDVGVVSCGDREMAAVRTPHGWACKTEKGIAIAPFKTLAAWRV